LNDPRITGVARILDEKVANLLTGISIDVELAFANSELP
jgi:hypothetical protein